MASAIAPAAIKQAFDVKSITAMLSAPFTAMRPIIGNINSAIDGLKAKTAGMFGGIADLVQKANPASFQQFQLAMNDMLAVLGQSLTPVLDVVTGLIRQFGDMLATLRPALDPLFESLSRLLAMLGQLLIPVAQVLTPLIMLMGAALQALEPIFQHFVNAMKWLARATVEVINKILEAYNWVATRNIGKELGLRPADMIRINFDNLTKQSSAGAAVQQASYSGISEFGQKARQTAFSQGLGKGMSEAEKQQIGWLERICNEMIKANRIAEGEKQMKRGFERNDPLEAMKGMYNQIFPWLPRLGSE